MRDERIARVDLLAQSQAGGLLPLAGQPCRAAKRLQIRQSVFPGRADSRAPQAPPYAHPSEVGSRTYAAWKGPRFLANRLSAARNVPARVAGSPFRQFGNSRKCLSDKKLQLSALNVAGWHRVCILIS